MTIRGNVISGTGTAPGTGTCCSDGFGLYLADAASSVNVIVGNRIGTDAAGTAAVGNRLYGIVVSSGGNTIGGTSAADRNLISGNGRGIMFIGSSAASNDVIGNYIGTNAAGTSALSNGIHGIVFNVAGAGNQIGGAGAGEGNVIAASGVGVEFVATSDQVRPGQSDRRWRGRHHTSREPVDRHPHLRNAGVCLRQQPDRWHRRRRRERHRRIAGRKGSASRVLLPGTRSSVTASTTTRVWASISPRTA